jgi:colanic acid/amylovoran biosynthesis glycosyltransferase
MTVYSGETKAIPLDGELPLRIAYIVSKFPKISETFILHEILFMRRHGVEIDIFPLVYMPQGVMHPEAKTLMDRVHAISLHSSALIMAQLYWLWRRPFTYCRIWIEALAGNISSAKFLSRAMIVVPKAAFFARRVKELNLEFIHAHWASHTALAAFCIKRLTGISYSITAHAHDIYAKRPMLGVKIHHASMIAAISIYNRELLARLYGPQARRKIELIRCGIDTPLFIPQQARKKAHVPLLACIASMEEYKGHSFLIEALAILKDRRIAFRSFFVGAGKLRPLIEESIARNKLSAMIRLTGPLPQDKIRRILRMASLYVQPSIITRTGKMEGIPVSIMEALAMELPVVATDISGVHELVEDGVTGILVPQKDPLALADAIQKCIQNVWLSQRLGQAGRKHVLSDYSIEKNAGLLYQHFRRLCNRPQAI